MRPVHIDCTDIDREFVPIYRESSPTAANAANKADAMNAFAHILTENYTPRC